MKNSQRAIKSMNIFDIVEQEHALMHDLRTLPKDEYRERLAYHNKLVARLYDFAIRDPLTKLLNRNAYDAILQELVHRGQQHDCVHTIFDIDDFKIINDTHGHGVGDKVLIAVAQGIRRVIGESSYMRGFAAILRDEHSARYGGEEFVVAYPDCSIDAGAIKAESLRKSVQRYVAKKKLPPVTLSAGIVSLGGVLEVLSVNKNQVSEERAVDAVYAFADFAMYCAKGKGKNQLLKAMDEIRASESPCNMGKLDRFVSVCWKYRNMHGHMMG